MSMSNGCGCRITNFGGELDESECAAPSLRARPQAFFANLAREIRRPSYGVLQKDFASALLLRAQEAGIYDPSKEPA